MNFSAALIIWQNIVAFKKGLVALLKNVRFFQFHFGLQTFVVVNIADLNAMHFKVGTCEFVDVVDT